MVLLSMCEIVNVLHMAEIVHDVEYAYLPKPMFCRLLIRAASKAGLYEDPEGGAAELVFPGPFAFAFAFALGLE